jgi:hypothetical protein
MMAYLAMMAPRLIELHRVLKETGSIYLHCDPTASHYLKMLIDAVFGVQQFRNESKSLSAPEKSKNLSRRRRQSREAAKECSPRRKPWVRRAHGDQPLWG